MSDNAVVGGVGAALVATIGFVGRIFNGRVSHLESKVHTHGERIAALETIPDRLDRIETKIDSLLSRE